MRFRRVIVALTLLGASCSSPEPAEPSPTTIDSDSPQILQHPSGLAIDVPAGSLYEPATIVLDEVATPEGNTGTLVIPDAMSYEISIPGEAFAAPVQVAIPYQPTLIPPGRTELDVFAVFLHEDTWFRMPSDVDPEADVVRTWTVHNGTWSWGTDSDDNVSSEVAEYFCREGADPAFLEAAQHELANREDWRSKVNAYASERVELTEAPFEEIFDWVVGQIEGLYVDRLTPQAIDIARQSQWGGKDLWIRVDGKVKGVWLGRLATLSKLASGAGLLWEATTLMWETGTALTTVGAMYVHLNRAHRRVLEMEAVVSALEKGCVDYMSPEEAERLEQWYEALIDDQGGSRPPLVWDVTVSGVPIDLDLLGIPALDVLLGLDSAADPIEPPIDTDYITAGESLIESIGVDLDGDGVFERVLYSRTETEFCGTSQIKIIDHDGSRWSVVYESNSMPHDLGVTGTDLGIVNLNPGPYLQLWFAHFGLGECGNNPEKDLWLVTWNGEEANQYLHLGFGGSVLDLENRLVVRSGNWEPADAPGFPSSCDITVYGWTGTHIGVLEQVGPISCDSASRYDGESLPTEIVLSDFGLGVASFGDDADAVVRTLAAILGPPLEDSGWMVVDPFFNDPPIATCDLRIVNFPGLTSFFGEEDFTGDLGFVGYIALLAEWRTATGRGVGSTVGDFPREALQFSDFGEGWQLYHDGLTFGLVDPDPDSGTKVASVIGGYQPCSLP